MMGKDIQLPGIDRNWITDAFIGVLIALIVWVIGYVVPGLGTIGIPSLPQSLSSETTRFVVVCILASVFETLFFFSIVLYFFDSKVKKFGRDLPFFVSAVISSLIFMGFHYSAYGLSGSSGAFVSAFIVGMVFAYETKYTNSTLPAIVTHGLLNYFIAFSSLVIFG